MTIRASSVALKGSLLALSLGLLAACNSGSDQPRPADRGHATEAALKQQLAGASSTAQAASSGSAFDAKGNPEGALNRVKTLVTGASHGNIQAERLFETKVPGLIGVVTNSPQGQRGVAFVSSDGSTLFPMAYNDQGESLSDKALVDEGILITPADALTQASAKAAKAIVVGKAGPVVTIFMDPNCFYCHKTYTELMPLVEAGKVRARFVMVGFLKPNSAAKSAAILADKNPASALDRDEKNFVVATEEGGITPAANAPADITQVVSANTQLLGKAGPIATPAVLFCDASGKVNLLRGAPQDINQFAASASTKGHDACAK